MPHLTVREIRPTLGLLMAVGFIGCAHTAPPTTQMAVVPSTQPAVLASVREVAAPQPEGVAAPDFSLTIYSSANPLTFTPQNLLANADRSGANAFTDVPGFGVVREVRTMKLAEGLNRLEFSGVAAAIDPTTVSFRSLTAPKTTAALEQNLEFDVATVEKMIAKSAGREVIITLKQPAGRTSGPTQIRGTLLSSTGYAYLVRTDDSQTPIVAINGDNVQSLRFVESKTGFVTRPTLNWQVATDRPGDHQVQVTYQTDGLTSHRTDYNMLLAEDEATADLSAWVTTLNVSGMNYPEAKLKLIAGNVRRYMPEYQGGAQFGGGGGDEAAAKAFNEKSFFEYHLYTLNRPTTLPNNSTKQIELFPAKSGLNIEKIYLYYGATMDDSVVYGTGPSTDRQFGLESNPSVDTYVRFQNSAANHLGIPLPAGRIRLYKADPTDGAREFIGEDVIRHTPKDEFVMVRLGSAFDLVGERIQTEYKEGERSAVESFSIKLRNHKEIAVKAIVKETLYRWSNWEITQSSDKWEKQDSRTIHIPVEIPANGEKVVTYSVKYAW